VEKYEKIYFHDDLTFIGINLKNVGCIYRVSSLKSKVRVKVNFTL
jgi:hypothetical protein